MNEMEHIMCQTFTHSLGTLTRFGVSIVVYLGFSISGWAKCDTLPLSQAYRDHQSLTFSQREPLKNLVTSPIVIGLHGLGHHKEGFSKLTTALPESWRLIFVDAPFKYHRGYAWYRFKCPERDEDLTFSTEALIRLITQIKKRYPHAPLAIFGFSQGGVMTLSLLERVHQSLSAAASLSGYWGYTRSPRPTAPIHTPLLITHGRQDRVVGLSRGENAVKLMTQIGIQVTPFYFSGGHRVTRDVLRSLIEHLQQAFSTHRAHLNPKK